MKLIHKFVQTIPDTLDDGNLYVSIDYGVVLHRCCCGCGNEVVTPLSPTDWKLTFDGQSVTLDPSIGNWSFECKSHYWIEKNEVIWARRWSRREIEIGRRQDARRKAEHYREEKAVTRLPQELPKHEAKEAEPNMWLRFKKWLRMNNSERNKQ